jgi:hypothetical protein
LLQARCKAEKRKGNWSGRLDSNQRSSAPKADAIPGFATPRFSIHITAFYAGRPDQPPLKLRRSAVALAKAEGLRYACRSQSKGLRYRRQQRRRGLKNCATDAANAGRQTLDWFDFVRSASPVRPETCCRSERGERRVAPVRRETASQGRVQARSRNWPAPCTFPGDAVSRAVEQFAE